VVNLGKWGSWSGGENKFSQMMYDKRQSCWNGPARSAMVRTEFADLPEKLPYKMNNLGIEFYEFFFSFPDYD